MKIKTTQVQALAQDCKTDVYFNTLSLLFPLIGVQTGTWWLDPVGAGLLSLYIIYDWAGTCFENITRLSGQAAESALEKKLLYLAYRFSPVVDGFKSVTSYHAGDGIWVEYDILLNEETRLHRTHDIAETLQYCCEGLGEVDRAFVTTDCKYSLHHTFGDGSLTLYRHFPGTDWPRDRRRAYVIVSFERHLRAPRRTDASWITCIVPIAYSGRWSTSMNNLICIKSTSTIPSCVSGVVKPHKPPRHIDFSPKRRHL